MATVYLYVLGASSDPDRCECGVPWRVDETEIFFGPCKKKLREELRPRFLSSHVDRASADEDVYLAGFNALPANRVRKLVWAGRVREAMSFGRAWLHLTGPRYERLRAHAATPLHLEPTAGEGRPTAYRHHGLQHAKRSAWLDDILNIGAKRLAQVGRGTVHLPPGLSWWEGFPRDICFLLDNHFFADGAGLPIDADLVDLLRNAQPDRDGVTEVAIFGLNRAGQADGRHGGYLELTGLLADRFLAWLGNRAPAQHRGFAQGARRPREPVRGRC